MVPSSVTLFGSRGEAAVAADDEPRGRHRQARARSAIREGRLAAGAYFHSRAIFRMRSLS